MKTKYSKQILIAVITLSQASDGVESHLLDFPALEVNDAILLNKVSLNIAQGACPPKFNGQSNDCYQGVFNWGLDSKYLETNGFDGDLLESLTAQCYSSHTSDIVVGEESGGTVNDETPAVTVTTSIEYESEAIQGLGGHRDQIDMTVPGYGNLNRFPAKCLYFQAEKQHLVSGGGIILRVDYNIVTLSSSEQAEAYRLSTDC